MFSAGARVIVVGGEYNGRTGTVESSIPRRFAREEVVYRVRADGFPKPGGWDGKMLLTEKFLRKADDLVADIIGGFPAHANSPNCAGCGKQLVIENAWMTDGCPCNTPLGVNSMNETRWRLLMQLQQAQARELESLRKPLRAS